MTVTIANLTSTWIDSNSIYDGIGLDVTGTSYDVNSKIFRLAINGQDVFAISANGNQVLATNTTLSNTVIYTGNVYGLVNASFTQSNNEVIRLTGSYTKLNAAYTTINAAYTQANTLATSANAYSASVGASGNAYALSTATSIGTSGNAYAASVGSSANAFAAATYSTLTQFGSVFGVANAGFSKANSVATSANAYASAVGQAANAYAASITASYTGSLTSTQITGALGFTPYNATNPSGYITSSALTPYAPLSGATFTGSITVGSGQNSSDIYMYDADEGTRRIHCNSNRIGFLNQSDGWGSWCQDEGWWGSDTSVRAPLLYDINDTGYYADPNSTSNMYRLNLQNYLYVYGGSNCGVELIGGWGQYGKVAQLRTDGAGAQDGPMLWFHKQNAKSWGCGIRPYSGDNGFWISEDSSTGAWGTRRFEILPGGQVNISAPDGGWNARPALAIASNGDGYLQTRHIRGKDTTGTGADHLYIQWDVAADVYLGRHLYGLNYYDRNDTGYYLDPNGTNRLNFVNSNNHYVQPGHMLYSDHGAWQGEYNKIQWHSSHLYLQNNGGGYLMILRRGDGGERFWVDYNGNMVASGNVSAYSDERLKENIETITNALDIINKLRGVTFSWIKTQKPSYGLIAQEVEKVVPELVMESENGTAEGDEKMIVKSVDYSKMVSILIEGMKEQQKMIDMIMKKLDLVV